MSIVVVLPKIPVMCVIAVGGAQGVQAAIDEVENKLQKNLKGRKCYGVITSNSGEMVYKACVVVQEGDNPIAVGLELGELPGGKYIRERVKNFDYRKDIPRLLQTFKTLADENEVDTSRPSLEFYRRHDEILVHVPIK